MNDALSLLQHALLLIGMWAMLRVWFAINRVVLRISTVILLLVGLYDWAMLAFVVLCVAESAHRGLMAQRRDAGSTMVSGLIERIQTQSRR